MKPLFGVFLPAFLGLAMAASPALADPRPMPEPWRSPPSPIRFIPGPCPAPHGGNEQPDKAPTPRPDPIRPMIKIVPAQSQR